MLFVQKKFMKCIHSYRPQTKFAKVMFSQVSFCPRRCVYPSMHLARGGCPGWYLSWGVYLWECGRHPLGPEADSPRAEADTPPLGIRRRHPLDTRGRHTLDTRGRHPPGLEADPPLDTTGYGQQAGGMYSTGMQSCCTIVPLQIYHC